MHFSPIRGVTRPPVMNQLAEGISSEIRTERKPRENYWHFRGLEGVFSESC
jgi:hypothetical protein